LDHPAGRATLINDDQDAFRKTSNAACLFFAA
jgi:hypothetical protein